MADVFVHRSFPSRFELHMYNSGNNFSGRIRGQRRWNWGKFVVLAVPLVDILWCSWLRSMVCISCESECIRWLTKFIRVQLCISFLPICILPTLLAVHAQLMSTQFACCTSCISITWWQSGEVLHYHHSVLCLLSEGPNDLVCTWIERQTSRRKVKVASNGFRMCISRIPSYWELIWRWMYIDGGRKHENEIFGSLKGYVKSGNS
jgi:hypothetical protein